MIEEKNGVETDYGCTIFDVPKMPGIELHIPIGSQDGNMYASICMTDEEAEEMIAIIRNKLNARI